MSGFVGPIGDQSRQPSLPLFPCMRAFFCAAFALCVVAPGVLRAQANDAVERWRAEAGVTQRPDGFLFRAPRMTLGLGAGVNLPRVSSQIFDFTTDQLTLEPNDFRAFAVNGDVGIRVADPLDVVLSFAYASVSKQSEFRDYVDLDDLPITQRTTFTQMPLTVGVRGYLISRGRSVGRFVWVPARLAPYVGAGAGVVRYSFRQVGSFVDFQDLSIFDTTFESNGWTPLAKVMAGLDYSLGPRVILNVDGRYQFASGELDRDFAEFGDGIDLSGVLLSVGVHFRL